MESTFFSNCFLYKTDFSVEYRQVDMKLSQPSQTKKMLLDVAMTVLYI